MASGTTSERSCDSLVPRASTVKCSRLGGTIVSSESSGRVKIGTAGRLQDALLESEDSETLNTSFVQRLNLAIRQGSAYLRRRSPSHARSEDQLRGHVKLLRCHYNFIRPHRALKFGRETRTPAMQAGLVSRPLTWRDIFCDRRISLRLGSSKWVASGEWKGPPASRSRHAHRAQ